MKNDFQASRQSLFDWESEPSLERSSSFFEHSSFAPSTQAHRARHHRRGNGRVVIIAVALIGGLGVWGTVLLGNFLRATFS